MEDERIEKSTIIIIDYKSAPDEPGGLLPNQKKMTNVQQYLAFTANLMPGEAPKIGIFGSYDSDYFEQFIMTLMMEHPELFYHAVRALRCVALHSVMPLSELLKARMIDVKEAISARLFTDIITNGIFEPGLNINREAKTLITNNGGVHGVHEENRQEENDDKQTEVKAGTETEADSEDDDSAKR